MQKGIEFKDEKQGHKEQADDGHNRAGATGLVEVLRQLLVHVDRIQERPHLAALWVVGVVGCLGFVCRTNGQMKCTMPLLA